MRSKPLYHWIEMIQLSFFVNLTPTIEIFPKSGKQILMQLRVKKLLHTVLLYSGLPLSPYPPYLLKRRPPSISLGALSPNQLHSESIGVVLFFFIGHLFSNSIFTLKHFRGNLRIQLINILHMYAYIQCIIYTCRQYTHNKKYKCKISL